MFPSGNSRKSENKIENLFKDTIFLNLEVQFAQNIIHILHMIVEFHSETDGLTEGPLSHIIRLEAWEKRDQSVMLLSVKSCRFSYFSLPAQVAPLWSSRPSCDCRQDWRSLHDVHVKLLVSLII